MTSQSKDEIHVAASDPAWPARFCEIAAPMRAALGDVALRLDHIGSTSIRGLDAKPVIDVQVPVAALEPSDAFREPLEGLGYRFRPANPDRAKRYFREPKGEARVHIHVRKNGSLGQQLALLFRDYLREHPAQTARYAALEHELAREFQTNRQGYVEAKEPFFWETFRRAETWAQRCGWEPGPSDA